MNDLFLLLFILSMVLFIVGLIKPQLVLWWLPNERRSRGKAMSFSVIAMILFLVLFGVTADPVEDEAAAVTSSNGEAKEGSDQEAENLAEEEAERKARKKRRSRQKKRQKQSVKPKKKRRSRQRKKLRVKQKKRRRSRQRKKLRVKPRKKQMQLRHHNSRQLQCLSATWTIRRSQKAG
ncbi:hypothetical protein JCM19045_2226 [Bacillus sp. JCM 19045]|nr:hypothetical protein JCM19045_2226 [Bacillus sp. JCM 19045]